MKSPTIQDIHDRPLAFGRLHLWAVVIGSILWIVQAGPAAAMLHFGTGFAEAWDFSDSTSTTSDSEWDFTAGNTALASGSTLLDAFLDANYPALIAVMPDGVTYESVLEAPADPGMYEGFLFFVPNRVWIVKTREGHYAKVRFFDDFFPGQFEYTYQDNGTRILAAPLRMEAATWGRIKALYR
jgi:hypothetical protein